ncbi:MAG: bifunctional DNA primase/polymerase [Gemmataceae bacterium]|nr:bifunctional DNA primase/polymerase [Gemmataceae bacterium]
MLTTVEAACEFARRGWSAIPIPYRSKNPGFDEWPLLRLTVETIPQHFNGHPQNVGVLLGEPSGWLIDVDLDHPKAVALAPEYLPSTPAIFGRPGNPRSHWLYRVTSPAATKKFKSKSAGMIVEFRSTGMQTVFPPSTHESGEPIRWEVEAAEPAIADPEQLLDCVRRLADAVKVELGEKAVPKPKTTKPPRSAEQGDLPPVETDAAADSTSPSPNSQERGIRCLAAMLRINMVDHNDGSSRLYACACRIVEHDLDDVAAVAALRKYAADRAFPKTWSDDEILARVRDAEQVCTRGSAFQAELDDDGLVALGQEAGVEGGAAKARQEIPLLFLHALADGCKFGFANLALPLQNHEDFHLDQRQPVVLRPTIDIRVQTSHHEQIRGLHDECGRVHRRHERNRPSHRRDEDEQDHRE